VTRLAVTAPRLAELEEQRRGELRERLRRLVAPRGDERVLDAGTGTGAVAFALSPLVREVVAVDRTPELLAQARLRADEFPNVQFVEGDITRRSFDIACSVRVLHHVQRPELAVAELVRVARPGALIVVGDQLAPVDPLAALDLNRFEQARDPTHTRNLADVDLRSLFEANGLVVRRGEVVREQRDLDEYLDLAGCEGTERERARGLAPRPSSYVAEIGWYVLAKPSFSA
jgi:ubiquinone/menaquinone biosynthesis C-methylase UbiE